MKLFNTAHFDIFNSMLRAAAVPMFARSPADAHASC
jgi:hypothetical protein